MDKIDIAIHDVIVSPLKKINNSKGDLYHIMRNFDEGYNGFGEVYISTINYLQIKAWKRHKKMISNIVVPIGQVKFIIADLRDYSPSYGRINE